MKALILTTAIFALAGCQPAVEGGSTTTQQQNATSAAEATPPEEHGEARRKLPPVFDAIASGDLTLRTPHPSGGFLTNIFWAEEEIIGDFAIEIIEIINDLDLLYMLAAGFYYMENSGTRVYHNLEIRLTEIWVMGGRTWSATVAEIIAQSSDATYIIPERKHSAPPIHVHTGTSAQLLASFDSVYSFTYAEIALFEWERPNNLVFWTDATVRDFSFIALNRKQTAEGIFYAPGDVLFTIPQFSPRDAFALDAAFSHNWEQFAEGEFPHLFVHGGIAFTDENGERRYMALFESISEEYSPPFVLHRFEPFEE